VVSAQNMERIVFNKPFLTGKETEYIQQAVASGKISGDGLFTQKAHTFFENRYGFNKVFLTTSCTDALEMAAMLVNIQPGDEVIVPSFTFVSTANAFVLRGAKIVFADCYGHHPNIDADIIESLITSKTKAIVPVHYAGIACNMDKITALAKKHNLFVVEDAAQCIDSFYKGKALGSIGHLSAFSFHETKNIISGEGGMIAINDPALVERAEVVREKGTNRSKFFRGEIDKYSWVDIGSSFLPSEIIAAFLYAQLENIDTIQQKRLQIWQTYFDGLIGLQNSGHLKLPFIPDYATNNGHMFYLVCNTPEERTKLIAHLDKHQVHAIFHYLPLHSSSYFASKHDGRPLPNTNYFSDCLVRLPFHYQLTTVQQDAVIAAVNCFFK